MGKGDKKSRRGKIVLGTSGVRRKRNKGQAKVSAPAKVKELEKVVAAKTVAEKPKKAEAPVVEQPKAEKLKAEKPKTEGVAKKTKKAEPVEKVKTDE